MGKEAASACARWFTLKDFPSCLRLVAVCDANPDILEWYKQVDTVTTLTVDYRELLALSEVDVVYVAVPHHLHEAIYIDVLRAGKDLLAEKPFGIDLAAARSIEKVVEETGRFVRCSSEFPFLPGPQKVVDFLANEDLGHILSVKAGFLHSSDLDPTKAINWKRQSKFCGQIGVMGDLGLHVAHLLFRLGFEVIQVYAQLQKIYTSRPDGHGGYAECDTWDNATLHTQSSYKGMLLPATLEMKRMSPTDTNTWYIEVLGTEAGIRYSTKAPKTLQIFERKGQQYWKSIDLGFDVPYPTSTGGIFEVGFPDCFMQMLAGYIAEREGHSNQKFRCATVKEAVDSHILFEAALQSHVNQSLINL